MIEDVLSQPRPTGLLEMLKEATPSEFAGIVSRPAQRALEGAGYATLEDLTHVTEQELLALHGFGPNGLRRLNEALAARGLAIGSALQQHHD
jgi:hypothetical protein